MERYPTKIPGYYGTPENLAQHLSRLRYDVNLAINRQLVLEYRKQAASDEKAGRPKLARELRAYANLLEKNVEQMEKIFKICKDKPGMKDEI